MEALLGQRFLRLIENDPLIVCFDNELHAISEAKVVSNRWYNDIAKLFMLEGVHVTTAVKLPEAVWKILEPKLKMTREAVVNIYEPKAAV